MSVPLRFEEDVLRSVCAIIAETNTGLTGSELGSLLDSCGIEDCSRESTKRLRLFDALWARQQRDRSGNAVAQFIMRAMNPARYVGARQHYDAKRDELNEALAFAGLYLGEDGKLVRVGQAATLSQAQERVSRLKKVLLDRRVHGDVLRFCQAELLQENYFHAVFEATKSLADKIRDMTGVDLDGTQLVERVFGFGKQGYPTVAFNALQTETEQNEHRGLANLLKGLFGTFRNTTAHVPKIKWPIGEQDALDMLTLASLLHRKLDAAALTGVGKKP